MKINGSIFLSLAIFATTIAWDALPCVAVDVADDVASRSGNDASIGDLAPPLNIEHWIQDADGQLEPVTEFQPGSVYIVEFWATSCAPCVASMPHLAEIQNKYDPKEVRIISITDESPETVEAFLDRPFSGEEAETYRELISTYSLTADPDSSVYDDYMKAFSKSGIPAVFIVGKDRRIEWIGHPWDMDEPLAAVVEDRWDRDEFAKEFKIQNELPKLIQRLSMLIQSGQPDEQKQGLADLQAYLDRNEDLPAMHSQGLKALRWQLLGSLGEGDQVLKAFREELQENDQDAKKLFGASQIVLLLPFESPGLEVDVMVKEAIEKIENRVIEDLEIEPDFRASAMLLVAQLYMKMGQFDESLAQSTAAKKLVEDKELLEYIEMFLGHLQSQSSAEPEGKSEPEPDAEPETEPKPKTDATDQAGDDATE